MSSVVDHLWQRVGPLLSPKKLGSVAACAQPFVVAALSRTAKQPLWVICPSVREQEEFASELGEWQSGARAFPELPAMEDGTEALLDPETAAERMEILAALGAHTLAAPLVITRKQLHEEVPDPSSLVKACLTLAPGWSGEPRKLAEQLSAAGYERTPQVGLRGQFSVRGGILDVFSRHTARPVRIEFDFDAIASLREFDPDTQISTGGIDRAEILLTEGGSRWVPLGKLAEGALLLSVGDCEAVEGCEAIGEGGEGEEDFFPTPFVGLGAGDLVMNEARLGMLLRQLAEWQQGGWMVLLAAPSEGEAARFREFCSERGEDVSWIPHLPLALAEGFVHPRSRTAVLADAALFGRSALLRAGRVAARRFRASGSRAATNFSEFEEGDIVVHLEHGIGCYEGLVASPDGSGEEVLAIRYAGDSRLYVPIPQAWQVSRYAGLGRARPELSDLASPRWQKAKEKAVASVFDYAARMLRVQAERETLHGHAFGPDTHWQTEFESAFSYRETADQLRAIAEAKRDMEIPRPMDRLICGDVGFGKTEVAIRALFKAVMDGKQAAMLAPTTVLARQHFQTLRERMSDYPVVVELLNRYRSPAEQRKVLKGLANGSVDIVVGTHRLVSPDISFQNLGLLIVDEEQRFGVKHKDILKERFRQVDVLTLSATPIPRTLYMALVGARDMSLIETPPPNRQPVETIVCAYDERVLRDAIGRELERGGQVYVLHNRVKTIERLASRIRELCPAAKVAVGHGQMEEHALEPVMEAFVTGRTDVLVSTTIIESGLDIPNANTIIIDRADLFGLADLYQLRGRVGRSGQKAYAYLMLPRDLMGAARRRVSAIKQYSELGSGFKIAMRDLELRGAGNMLGTAQSGHIMAVGFDLYCKLLRRAVDSLSKKTRFARAECAVRLDFVATEETSWLADPTNRAPAFLPASFVPDASIRIACYRQLAEAEDHARLESLAREWRDRFGPLPEAASNALALAAIAVAGALHRISSVEVRDSRLILTRRGHLIQSAGRFPRLTLPEPPSRLREIREIIESLAND